MFSLYYVVKNVFEEIKSENEYDRSLYKLYKYNDKLRACMQKYTARFYVANYDRGYTLNKFVLINHIHEVEYMIKENSDTIQSFTYSNAGSIKQLILKTKEKIKDLKSEMRSM